MPDMSAAPPRVAMIVNNDVAADNRVKKTAVALARAGADVTIIGWASTGVRHEAVIGPVRVIWVPVDFRLREAQLRRRSQRRSHVPRVGFRTNADASAALLQIDARRREIKAASGHALHERDSDRSRPAELRYRSGVVSRRARLQWLSGRQFAVRARGRIQRDVNRWNRQLWRGYDFARHRIPVLAPWRRVLPELDDYERAYAPVLDELSPDVVHAHDYHMVGIADRAVGRARLRGRRARWVYDAHEYTRGLPLYGPRTPRILAAYADLEGEYIRHADAIVTVSPSIADTLQRDYHLARRPSVVMNIPSFEVAPAGDAPSIRAAAGLDDDAVVLVYSGGVTPARGIATVIEALPMLPDVQFVLVAVPAVITPFLQSLLDRAEQLSVRDRVHVVPPVEAHHVVGYLSSATVAVHPMVHYPSHDMALPNKLFEYLHARVPVVVSDCREMARFVTELGLGEVFPVGDSAALAESVCRVVDDRAHYLRVFTEQPELLETYTWERQADELRRVYADLLGRDRIITDRSELAPDVPDLVPVPVVAEKHGTTLAIGPANMAGQAWAWAKSVERWLDGDVHTEVVAVEKETLTFPADSLVSAATFTKDLDWQTRQTQHAVDTYTHVLLEAGRPMLGSLHGRDFTGDAAVLRDAGVAVGLLFHGSEIRDPRRHRELYPFSPFKDPGEALTARLQRQVDILRPLVDAFDGPKFVSTPDLLDDVTAAVWLPVVVDTDVWQPVAEPPLQRRVPVVVHAPSNKALKGTHLIEPILERLQSDGLIEYRRIENVPPADVPKFVAEADIVLDHFGIGNYGVMTCQAMAMGLVSVSHIHERVRSRVPDEIPTIEATPDDLDAVLRRILDQRDWARSVASDGPGFVDHYHNGRMSAAVLADFLGVAAPAV